MLNSASTISNAIKAMIVSEAGKAGISITPDDLFITPGIDRWGIGYRQLSQLNPRLVYCWVGQLGQWGPLKDKPGNLDPTAQAATVPPGLATTYRAPERCGFLDAPGARLRWATWSAPGTPRGSVVLLGGRGEFIEKYATEVVGEIDALSPMAMPRPRRSVPAPRSKGASQPMRVSRLPISIW